MEKDLFYKELIKRGVVVDKSKQLQTIEEKKEEKTTRAKTASKKIFKSLKEQYQPIYCYNIYDLQDNEILMAQFNNLEDLLQYINKYENTTISLSRLKHIIKEHYVINDRYEIVKDKLQKIAFIEDLQKGILYDNKSYNYC